MCLMLDTFNRTDWSIGDMYYFYEINAMGLWNGEKWEIFNNVKELIKRYNELFKKEGYYENTCKK